MRCLEGGQAGEAGEVGEAVEAVEVVEGAARTSGHPEGRQAELLQQPSGNCTRPSFSLFFNELLPLHIPSRSPIEAHPRSQNLRFVLHRE